MNRQILKFKIPSDYKEINVVLNKTGNIISVNAEGTKILGYPQKEIIGENWFENFIPKETIAETTDFFKTAIKKGLNDIHAGPIINSANKTKDIFWKISVITNKKNKTIKLSLIGHEIKSEQQLCSLLFRTMSKSSNIESLKPLTDKYHGDTILPLKNSCFTDPETKKVLISMLAKLTAKEIIKVHHKSAMLLKQDISSSIAEFSNIYISSDKISLDKISNLIIEKAGKITKSHLGFIGHIDKKTDCIIVSSFTKTIWNKCAPADRSMVLKKFCDSWKKLIKTKEPIILNNFKNNKQLTYLRKCPLKIQNFICATFPVNDRLTGIAVMANSSKSYTDVDLKYIKVLGNFYTIALNNEYGKEQILASEEKYKAIVNASLNIIYTIDSAKIIRFVNKKAKKYGYIPENIINKPLSFFCHPDDKKRVYDTLDKIFKTGAVKGPLFFRIKKKDGSYFYVEQKNGIIFKDGKPKLISAIAHDMTEQKLIEKNLRQEKEHTELIMKTIPSGVFTVNKKRIITSWNDMAEKIIGYSAKEIIGNTCRIFAGPSCKKKCGLFAEDIPKPLSGVECEIKHKDGERRFILKNIEVLRNESGKVTTGIESFEDITERKKLQNELLQSQKMDAIGKLAAGLAHDFNNVLGAIEGYASIIKFSIGKDSPINADLDEIIKTVEKTVDITKQLLTLGRKNTKMDTVVNPNEILKSLRGLLKKFTGENIKLNFNFGKNLPNIKIDRTEIEQVIVNLAINARDALKDIKRPGIVNIKTSLADTKHLSRKMIKISITDNGVGIKKKYIENIFEPLFTTKAKGQGTGLGLSTAYSIIDQHSGNIKVSSKENKGATFNIYLPTTGEKIAEKNKKIQVAAKTTKKGSKKRILLIEDDDNLRNATSKALKLDGFTIFSCANCAEAEKVFNKENGNFNIIFSDVILPDGSGIKLTKKLIKTKPAIKLVITSGHMDAISNAEKMIKSKYTFIQKPYKQNLLLKIFNNS